MLNVYLPTKMSWLILQILNNLNNIFSAIPVFKKIIVIFIKQNKYVRPNSIISNLNSTLNN